jgi:hypothetical protein
MLERGPGSVIVIDQARDLKLRMLTGDSDHYCTWRLEGPGLSVVFSTTEDLVHRPPKWAIQFISLDRVDREYPELKSLITEFVAFVGASLLETEPSKVIAQFG